MDLDALRGHLNMAQAHLDAARTILDPPEPQEAPVLVLVPPADPEPAPEAPAPAEPESPEPPATVEPDLSTLEKVSAHLGLPWGQAAPAQEDEQEPARDVAHVQPAGFGALDYGAGVYGG